MFQKIKKIFKFFPIKQSLGACGKNSRIEFPAYIAEPGSIFMEENTLLRKYVKIQNTPKERIYIKKYTVIGINCSIITNSHRSTVGIPQVILGPSHINDSSSDLIIGEDVWVGINVTILQGAHLGRGCICGACSTVTKPVPPYALVVGSPAKIVGVKFTIEQIIEHEKALYKKEERFTKEYLEELFEKYYKDKKVFGVKTDFTEEDLLELERAKKQRNFIELNV